MAVSSPESINMTATLAFGYCLFFRDLSVAAMFIYYLQFATIYRLLLLSSSFCSFRVYSSCWDFRDFCSSYNELFGISAY